MCLVLIPALGASGAAWAILAAEIGVLGIIIPLKTSQVVPVGAIRQIAVTHRHALLGFSVSAAAASAAIALTGQESIGALVVAGTLWIAIAGVPIFFLLFEKEKRHWLLKKFRDRLARSKQP